MTPTTRRAGAAVALAAVAAGAAITVTQQRPAPARAENHCPVGCVETDLSTLNPPGGMTFITQQTRGPWIVGKPPTSGLQTPSTTATRKTAPKGKP